MTASDGVVLPVPSPVQAVLIVPMERDQLPRLANGKPSGMTLARLMQEIGGLEGEFVSPFTGRRTFVSLREWETCDPESTWFYVAVEDG